MARNGIHIKLTRPAYVLLSGLAGGDSAQALAERLSREEGRAIGVEDVETACNDLLGRVASIAAKDDDLLPGGFWLRRRLLPREGVQRIARRLAWLCGRPAVVASLLAIAAALALAVAGGPPLRPDPGDLLPAYALFLASLVWHELGHATAAARFGARPSDIGVAMYLIYPVFYSDVTTTWQLRRAERVAVDLGGVYFQFMAAAVYVGAFLLSGWSPLWTAFVLILYATLFSLNPIFRFDGYWFLSDALGVTNLSRQPARLARHALDRVRGRRPAPLPWPAPILAALSAYSVVSVAVWGFFVWLLVPALVDQLRELPLLVGAITGDLRALRQPGWAAVRHLLATVMLLTFAALIGIRLSGRLLSLAPGRRHG